MSEAVRAALTTVVDGGSLSLDDARAAMGSVMDGEATPAQLAALLVALRMRGETADELAGFAAAMRERVVRVEAPVGAIDVVGTGGDGSGTFNISTAAALVTAAAGVPVAKHGNRAITSQAGSADVLEALGVRTDHTAESAGVALRELGFAFLFAPNFHPAMKHAGPTRREIGVRTAFNLIGPLTNPAGTTRQLLGVGDAAAAEKIAEVAQRLGTERTFVIHGAGVDELPLDGSGVLYDVTPDGIEKREIAAAALGLQAAPTTRLAGGDAAANAAIVRDVLRGEPGARRNVVLLNAAAALMVAGRADDLAAGVELAGLTIDSGLATELLERLQAREAGRRRGRRGHRGDAGVIVADAPIVRAPGRSVVADIAARRREDVLAEMSSLSLDDHLAIAASTPPPRSIVDRLAAPGLHVIAEVKRRSPSAGVIAAPATTWSPAPAPTQPAVRRPSPSCASRTGSAARSTTCGRSARRSRSRSWPRSSSSSRSSCPSCAPPAPTSCCCWPCSILPAGCAGSSSGRWRSVSSRSSRRTTSASSTGRSARRPGSSASTTATCGRSPSIPERAVRLRDRIPDDRLAIAESGVREAVDRGRLAGRRLRCGAHRRGARASTSIPTAAVRSFVAAGRVPDRSGQRRRHAPSSRSAASPTRTGSSPRSGPAPTRSGSTSCPARPGRWSSARRSSWPAIARALTAGGRTAADRRA